jgi:hypothetical protein
LTDAHDDELAPQSPQTDIGCLDGELVSDDDFVFSILVRFFWLN